MEHPIVLVRMRNYIGTESAIAFIAGFARRKVANWSSCNELAEFLARLSRISAQIGRINATKGNCPGNFHPEPDKIDHDRAGSFVSQNCLLAVTFATIVFLSFSRDGTLSSSYFLKGTGQCDVYFGELVKKKTTYLIDTSFCGLF